MSSIEKYQVQVELLAKELRKSINRAEALEDGIIEYLAGADKKGTFDVSALRRVLSEGGRR